MQFKKKVKRFFKTFDFFAHNVSFRYADQPAYESVTGGVCSVIMIIAFIAIFMGTAINTLNKVYIYSSIKYLEDIDPTYYKMGTDTFMFAISLTGINMNEGQRWFDLYMQYRSYDNKEGVRNKTYIPLVPCQKQVWVSIGENLGEVYDRLNLDQWLCPSSGQVMQLEGKYTSQKFKFYKFAVKQCDPDLDPTRPCVNESQIQSFLDDEQAFNFNFYFVNMILNPGANQYLTYYLDDLNYFPFSRKSGVNANLFLSTFNITTDESILPWNDMKQDVGGIVMNTAQMLNYEVRQNQYMKFYLRKSSLMIQVQRSFRKADDTLSYVGGLFSAILSLLLLMSLYNQFSFQLQIAKNLYHIEKGKPLDAQGFNFLVYLGYLIYLIFDKFSIDLPWKRMRQYHHSLQQVRKQMDMRLIMKKILYSQRMATAILDEHKAKILHLQEPLTLEEAQIIRKDHRFYEKLQQYSLVLQQNDLCVQKSECPLQQGGVNDMVNTNYYPSQASPTKRANQTSLTFIGKSSSKVNNQKQQVKERVQREIQLQEQYEKRIQKLKEYIVQLKREQKNGDKVSKRILQKYDSQLLGKLFDHNKLYQQHLNKQRKFNLFPQQVFNFSEQSEQQKQPQPQFNDKQKTP